MSWMLSMWVAAALLAQCMGESTVLEGMRLSASGYYLCKDNVTKNVSFLAIHKVPFTVTTKCGSWLQMNKCTDTLYQIVHQTEHKMVREEVTRCCHGYEQVGSYCALPVNRSGEFTAKPGICPSADGVDTGSEACEWDMDCPGWQKCCHRLGRYLCTNPATLANYPVNGGCRFNATVTVKADYQQLMSSGGHVNHLRLLQAMVTGALEANVSIKVLDLKPLHPYRTSTSLLIEYNNSLSLHSVTTKLHLLLAHIQEVSSVTVEDVNECKHPALCQCSIHASCTNTEGSYRCTCLQGYTDVNPSSPGAHCRAEISDLTTTEPPQTYSPPMSTTYKPASTTSTVGFVSSTEISMTTDLTTSSDSPHSSPWMSTEPYTTMKTTVETTLPTTTCSPPSITSLWSANVTGTNFSIHWSSQPETNQTYQVVVKRESEVVYYHGTSETMMKVQGLQPGVLYSVTVTPCACGSQGGAFTLQVKTDAQTLDATARITNIQYTADLENKNSQAYKTLSKSLEEEIYLNLPADIKDLVDLGQARIVITGFFSGSVVVKFSIALWTQSQNISDTLESAVKSLLNSKKYSVDPNNTSIDDSDECASGQNDCSQWAICTNTWASYTCVCLDGFIDKNKERPGRACQGVTTTEMITTPLKSTASATVSTTAFYETTSTSAATTPVTTTVSTPRSTTVTAGSTTGAVTPTAVPVVIPTQATTTSTTETTTLTFSTTAAATTTINTPATTTSTAETLTTKSTTTTIAPTTTTPASSVTTSASKVTTHPITTISTTETLTSTSTTTTFARIAATSASASKISVPKATTTPTTTTPKTETPTLEPNATSQASTTALVSKMPPSVPTTTTLTSLSTSLAPKLPISSPATTIPVTPTSAATTFTILAYKTTISPLKPNTTAPRPTTLNETTTALESSTTTRTPETTTAIPKTTRKAFTTITMAPKTTTAELKLTTTPTVTSEAMIPKTTITAKKITSTSKTTITWPKTTTAAPKTTTTDLLTTIISMKSKTSTPITIPTTVATTISSMPGAISVQCRVAAITVAIAKDFLQSADLDVNGLYLGLPECAVNGGNETHVELTVDWYECQTKLVHNDTFYIASATLYNSVDSYTSLSGEVVVPKIRLEVPIVCTYMKSMLISADFGSMGYDMIKDVIVSSGSFQVTVQLMNGSIPLPQNYSMSSEEDLVVEVSLNTSSEHIKVVINKCWATPTPNPGDTFSHTFLENSCSLNSYTKVLTNGNFSASRLSVRIFSVVNLNIIYLHCQVQICVQIGSDSCVPDCLQRTARTINTIGTALGTSGPLLRSDEESLEDDINTLHIAGLACLGIGISFFFIIGFVCLFYYQRNRIGHYNFSVKPKQENFTYLVFNT